MGQRVDMREAIAAVVSSLWTRGSFSQAVASRFVVQIASVAFSLVTSVVVARWLGPEGKGVLALTLLVPNMLSVFLNGGIGLANVYYAGTRKIDIETLVSNSLLYVVGATAVGFGVVFVADSTGFIARFVPGLPLWLLWIGMLSLPAALLEMLFETLLQGRQRVHSISSVDILRGVIGLVMSLVLVVVWKLDRLGVVLAAIAAAYACAGVLGVMVYREVAPFRWRPSLVAARQMAAFGLRGYVGNLLQFFNYRLDVFIVNAFLGASAVGVYGVAVAMAEMLWFLPQAVGFVILPKAAAMTPQEMNRFTPRVFRYTMCATALGALGLAVLGRPLIHLLYSWRFDAAFVPLLALLPGVVCLGGAKVLTNEIAGRGHPEYNSISSGVSLVVTLALDLLLIPWLGPLGAGLASSVSYVIAFGCAILFFRKVSSAAT